MYEIFLKCDITSSWTPPSCHKLSHLLGPPPPRAWRALWTAPRGFHAIWDIELRTILLLCLYYFARGWRPCTNSLETWCLRCLLLRPLVLEF